MKFLHLSDLHIGKKVNGFSMAGDQRHILSEIVGIAAEEAADAVIIAGDVYDKSVPAAEVVEILDEFLTSLVCLGVPVYIISGNHDSARRLAFGSRLFSRSGVFISPAFSGKVPLFTLEDEYGEVNIYLLPFLKPADVRPFFENEKIENYTDALRCVISSLDIDENKRNIAVSHQFAAGAQRSESEELSVGGLDSVDPSVYSVFDYTALGHLHSPQNAGKNIRYCGTPLKYSVSEIPQKKSVSIVELKEKGSVTLSKRPLTPLRDMRRLRGTYEELTARENYAGTNTDDYIYVTLTDEQEVPQALYRLRSIYENIIKLDYENTRTTINADFSRQEPAEKMSAAELFEDLYQKQNNQPLSPAQKKALEETLEEINENN